MDHKKVTRRQNRHKPSEDTIAEARRVAGQCLKHHMSPTVEGHRKLMLEQIRADIERAEAAIPSDWDALMKTDHLQLCLEHDTVSFQMACLAATLIERGEPLPPLLRPLIASRLRRIFHHMSWFAEAEGPPAKWQRDAAIWIAVIEVCRKTGLPPTRNVTTDTPSACSIVAEVLREFGIDRGEDLIGKIWREHNKLDAIIRDEGPVRQQVDGEPAGDRIRQKN
jgi:hypothetical protein